MDAAAPRTQDTNSSQGAPAGSPSITRSIRDSPIRTEETIAPGRAFCAEKAGANIPRETQAAKIRTGRERAITSAKSVSQNPFTSIRRSRQTNRFVAILLPLPGEAFQQPVHGNFPRSENH